MRPMRQRPAQGGRPAPAPAPTAGIRTPAPAPAPAPTGGIKAPAPAPTKPIPDFGGLPGLMQPTNPGGQVMPSQANPMAQQRHMANALRKSGLQAGTGELMPPMSPQPMPVMPTPPLPMPITPDPVMEQPGFAMPAPTSTGPMTYSPTGGISHTPVPEPIPTGGIKSPMPPSPYTMPRR